MAMQLYAFSIFLIFAIVFPGLIHCSPLKTTPLNLDLHVKPGVPGTTVLPSDKCLLSSSSTNSGPLFLTPYLEKGCLQEARELSKVKGVPGMYRDSFSGFFTVRKNVDANLFFWFIPAQFNAKTAPVLLWLSGGPGTSSLSGLFAENGPYYVTENNTLKTREYNWATYFNMIYLDNPVGAGFSFAKSIEAYPNSSQAVAQDAYKAVVMFFQIFNQYSSNEFYVAGQSYAGKFAADLAFLIASENPTADNDKKINFKGAIIIAGFVDPPNMLAYADYFYQVGLLDPKDYPEALNIEEEIREKIRNGDPSSELHNILYSYAALGGNYLAFLWKSAVFQSGESILTSVQPRVFQTYPSFVNCSDIRKAIHVANLTFNAASIDIPVALAGDFLIGVTSAIENLLKEGYKVLLMSGNLDIYVLHTHFHNMAWNLNWEHSEDFRKANRTVWKVDEKDRDFAGYVTVAKNLCYSLVRNGGHRLTSDQTRATADLIRRFIDDLF